MLVETENVAGVAGGNNCCMGCVAAVENTAVENTAAAAAAEAAGSTDCAMSESGVAGWARRSVVYAAAEGTVKMIATEVARTVAGDEPGGEGAS